MYSSAEGIHDSSYTNRKHFQAGFPFNQLDRFLKILVQDLNQFVAVSEEFPNKVSGTVKAGGLMFDRKITRTISPGTLIDENFMDPFANNFLLAIQPSESDSNSPSSEALSTNADLTESAAPSSITSKPFGLAWLDLSTGDFFTQSTTLGSLASATARIGARETILANGLEDGLRQEMMSVLELQRHNLTYHTPVVENTSVSLWNPMLETNLTIEKQSAFTTEEVAAGSLLLDYVKDRLQGNDFKLQGPVRKQDIDAMSIDRCSMRALEILGTSREGLGGGKGSLIHTVRRTVTKSGARLLRDRIASPSMSLDVIKARLDLVSLLLHDRASREDIVNLLRRSADSQRLVQRFSMGRGDADDLISLLQTMEVTESIAGKLDSYGLTSSIDPVKDEDRKQQQSLQSLRQRLSLDGPRTLASSIRAAIDEDGLMESRRIEATGDSNMASMAQDIMQAEGTAEDQTLKARSNRSKAKEKPSPEQEQEEQDVWILRTSASPLLQTLHETLDNLREDKMSLTTRLKHEFNAQSLTLRWTPALGYICHVKGTKEVTSSLKFTAATRDVKTTKSTRSFHQAEWSSLGGRIDQAKQRIRAEELQILRSLREQVVVNLVKLRRNATVLDELDISCSFATFAEEQNLVRPILNLGLDHKIIGGRHPCVTQGLEEQGRAFVSNDCLIGEKERIWLITGPNMAGKSTFLRQNALISILAQVGSFVPATHAEIGLVDRIFTRVGSADDLFRDQSTFMVEMMETATILNQATPQSFVIMDEIGRGTSPEEGIAVGFACLHHLYHKNRCRMLFATHFHALADMTKDLEHVAYYCTDVVQGPGDTFSFVHRLREGVNRSSHALKVARLAGIPNAAIETAQNVLKNFENRVT